MKNKGRTRLVRGALNSFNSVTLVLARSGHGPFSLIRHVGRKTGKAYETPLVVARSGDGFIAVLTFGSTADWYRNIQAAGHCVIVFKGTEYPVDRIDRIPAARGRRAFGAVTALLLRLLRRNEFRQLHRANCASAAEVSAAE